MASAKVSHSAHTRLFHFSLFTACWPLSSFRQALQLDAAAAPPLPNVPDFPRERGLSSKMDGWPLPLSPVFIAC